jgi:hypothetical protein
MWVRPARMLVYNRSAAPSDGLLVYTSILT